MKTLTTTLATLIVLIFAATVTASPAVEMKLVSSDGHQGFTTVSADRAPAGAYVEATIDLDGATVTVDMAAVCGVSGNATVAFPGIGRNHRVVLKSKAGAVLCSSYVGSLEND